MTRPSTRREGRSTSAGQAIAELVLVLPILILLLLGTVDVGRVIFAYIALEEAVQEGASYAAAMSPTDAATRYSNVRWRVVSSADHPEVVGATVANPSGVQCDPSTGLITVRASYGLPLITPIGSALFGGTYTLTATVISTNIHASCT